MSSIRAFTMPKWGIEMLEGTVAEWLVAEGEAFTRGQKLVLIETDKIVNEVEAEFDGSLRKLVAQAGERLPVGALLGVFAGAGDSQADIEAFAAAFRPAETSTAVGNAAASGAPAPTAAVAAPPPVPANVNASPEAIAAAARLGVDLAQVKGTGRDGRISRQDVDQAARPVAQPALGGVLPAPSGREFPLASPAARRIASEHGIDLAGITATGGRGRISKADVLARVAPVPAAAPARAAVVPGIAPDNKPEIVPMDRVRKVVARRLTEAKSTIPHFYLRMSVTVDALLALRKTANRILGCEASINDYLVRACGVALAKHPDVNVQVHGDAIHRFRHADVSVAVASPNGLVTPIVRGVDVLRVDAVAAATKDLIARAQAGRLSMGDLEGGTFTVSNLGMFGIDQFDAIINPPQGAILAVGGIQRVFVEGADGTGRFASKMALALSCDHRAIDGAAGAKFMATLRGLLEDPQSLFD
jgi:pyruvate dehydrogenase E2 component (dihydrolipoamide acetyltransferase)